MSKKVCRNCKDTKENSEFTTDSRNKDGTSNLCKICNLAKVLEYERIKREQKDESFLSKVREKVRRYSRLHPEKQAERKRRKERIKRTSKGKFTKQEFIELCEKYGNLCLCCKEGKPLTPDHVIPLTLGGENSISNIQPLCRECNSRKGTRAIDYR